MRKGITVLTGLFLSPHILVNAKAEASNDLLVCQITAPVKPQPIVDQVSEFFSGLFNTSSWPARWECGDWSSFHGWLYISSDILIWLSYFMIPITLGYFVYKRKSEPFSFRLVIVLFIVFILGCGLTHLIDAAIFWWPAYRLSALIRFLTAGVSLATVFALIRIAPEVIQFKSPAVLGKIVEERTKELLAVNTRLQHEIGQRILAEQKITALYKEVEQKYNDVEEINRQLIKRERDLIKNEQMVKALNAGLESEVENRTAELAVANRELEAFTYSVSHDLRAPLRAIDGYARILEEDLGSKIDGHKHLINVITKNAKYMGQLIDDLLEFSRTSRMAPNKILFSTEEEVKQILDELLQHEKNRTININLHELQPCKGDFAMLKQVWVNLISNSLKYTRKNPEPVIEIGSELKDNEVVYYIRDNGVGFDMDYVGKLFGVFQRLHRKEEFEGTGVGLALVKRILERHHGRIWAEAVLNKGATFYFTLPL
jgi:signal transduction histidine kinase